MTKSARPTVSRPAIASPFSSDPFTLFLHWLALAGLLLAAAILVWRLGVLRLLIGADPTYLTVVIIMLLFASTLWCGLRARALTHSRTQLDHIRHLLNGDESSRKSARSYVEGIAAVGHAGDWIAAYFAMILGKGAVWRDNAQLTDWLAEYAHGPHETAWWINGLQLKLGLLGKVIGFSVLALDLGAMESFDPSQSQALLKALTGGLGIALLTTMTGLIGNIILGFQLTRLDRYADGLVADALRIAESDLAMIAEPAAAQPATTLHA